MKHVSEQILCFAEWCSSTNEEKKQDKETIFIVEILNSYWVTIQQ